MKRISPSLNVFLGMGLGPSLRVAKTKAMFLWKLALRQLQRSGELASDALFDHIGENHGR
jgi:hypothetical protein